MERLNRWLRRRAEPRRVFFHLLALVALNSSALQWKLALHALGYPDIRLGDVDVAAVLHYPQREIVAGHLASGPCPDALTIKPNLSGRLISAQEEPPMHGDRRLHGKPLNSCGLGRICPSRFHFSTMKSLQKLRIEVCMKLTGKLIKECFGPDAKISGGLLGDYRVRTPSGGKFWISAKEVRHRGASAEDAAAAVLLWKRLGHETMTVTGDTKSTLNWVSAAQAQGIQIRGKEKGWFIFKKPAPVIPLNSGSHGTAKLARLNDIRAGGLLGHKWGTGIRLAYAPDINGEYRPEFVMRYTGENSLITVGDPGTGKMTDQIAPAIWENRDRHIISVCPKGQAAPMCIEQARKRGKVKVFYPTAEGLPDGVAELLGPTDTYNAMRAVLKGSLETLPINADALASTIVPEENSGSDGGIFSKGATRIVSGVMQGLMLYAPPEKQNLGEVARIITTREVFKLAFEWWKRPGSEYVMQRLGILTQPGAPADKTVCSILATVDNAVSFLCNPSVAHLLGGTSGWCFTDLKREKKPVTVFIMVSAKFAQSSALLRIFSGAAMQELLSSTRGPLPVLFIIDEFANLGRIPVFETAFTLARGYGVQLWVFVQNVPQISSPKLYGEKAWKSFLSGVDVQMYLSSIREPETARFVSDMAGSKTVGLPQYSYSAERESAGWGEHPRPVFTPHEVMGLPRNTLLMFAWGRVSNVMLCLRRPYFDDDELKRKAVIGIDPYHEPLPKRKVSLARQNTPPAPAKRVTTRCPHCQRAGEVYEDVIGLKLACPGCGREFRAGRAA
jgi:type IV secretion system protein VirD4